MPRAHINTPLTEADKIEAKDKSGQSRFSKGDWGHPVSATDHSVADSSCGLFGSRENTKRTKANENFSQSLMSEYTVIMFQASIVDKTVI